MKSVLLVFFALMIFPSMSQALKMPDQETAAVSELHQFLQSAGLQVKKLARSHWEGTFKDEQEAAFLETDLGVVEAVIFPPEIDPYKLQIRLQTEQDKRSVARYHYSLEGLPTNGEAAQIDSAAPIYFTVYQNWLLITLKSEVENRIKAKIHGRQP